MNRNFFSVVCLLVFVSSSLLAQEKSLPKPKEPIPYAYTVSSINGKHFFVMLPPDDANLDKQDSAYRDQTNRLKRAYEKSGVYRKGESTPVWVYTGPYAFDSFVSNDGQSVVIMHGTSWFTSQWPMADRIPADEESKQLDGPAISFYRNGQLLKTHTVRELVNDPSKLRNSISHIQWRAGEGLVEDRGSFQAFTQDSMRCRFDLATGELLEKKAVDYTNQKIIFGVIFGFVAIGTLFAIRWLVKGPKASV